MTKHVARFLFPFLRNWGDKRIFKDRPPTNLTMKIIVIVMMILIVVIMIIMITCIG